MKLSLGTAQFGSRYGISNSVGQPDTEEITSILSVCRQFGISYLDTAPAYHSEAILGQTGSVDGFFHVTTKTPALIENLERSLSSSLEKLKINSVYGLLLHDTGILGHPCFREYWERMQKLKRQGLVKKIGVSVYEETQINQARELGGLDLVQAPVSLLDQRLLKSGILRDLKKEGVEIHARSAFLQGLFFLEAGRLPGYFQTWAPHLAEMHLLMKKADLTVSEAALGFVVGLEEVDRVVVGVNRSEELKEILVATVHAKQNREKLMELAEFAALEDERILNPALWPKK